MNEMLKLVLSLSLSGGVLILALLLSRPLWKDRVSKTWQYYIWLIVIARLLLPVPTLPGGTCPKPVKIPSFCSLLRRWSRPLEVQSMTAPGETA